MSVHWRIGSFLTVVAVVFLSDLAVVNFLSPAFDRLPFPGGALVEAMAVAVFASPFLWHFAIRPFQHAIQREARKSSTVLDAAPEGIIEVSPDGRIQSVNAEVTRLFGYTREELTGKEIEMLLPQRFRDQHVQMRERYIAHPRTRPMGSGFELVGRKKNGEEFPVEVSLSTINEKESPLVICVLRDVGLQKAARNEITQINERLTESLAAHKALSETLVHLSDLGELMQSCTTRQEAYPIVAKMCERLFRGQAGAVYLASASKTALEQVTAWGQTRPSKAVVAAQECWALRRGKVHTSEILPCDGCRRSPEEPHEARTVCVPMIAQGDMIGTLHFYTPRAGTDLQGTASLPSTEPDTGVLTAVAERISVAMANLRLREELRHQAIRDAMTGLFNRRFLKEYLELELLRAMRNGWPLTLMMLDVDHFKRFNDTFGHKAGDLVLREVAGILRTQTRGSDIVCRYGGEELTVVSPETSSGQAVARAEQIRQAIENLTVIDDGQLLGKVTISIGLASVPEHGYDMTELLRAADEALYAAKKGGRNRVACATSKDQDIVLAEAATVPAVSLPLPHGHGSESTRTC
jgi:diguanylate cyclase (GGDEF)-like protein/PAS domain S-box-containing protein